MVTEVMLIKALTDASRDLDEQSRFCGVLRSMDLRSASRDLLSIRRDKSAMKAVLDALTASGANP